MCLANLIANVKMSNRIHKEYKMIIIQETSNSLANSIEKSKDAFEQKINDLSRRGWVIDGTHSMNILCDSSNRYTTVISQCLVYITHTTI